MKNEIIPTNVDFLDKQLGGGLSKGINVIGSCSGVGKSLFSMMICNNINQNNYNVLHLTFEDDPKIVLAKYYKTRQIINLNSKLFVKRITERDPKFKDIKDLINEYSFDVVLLDGIYLDKFEYNKLINYLKTIDKPILLTRQLKRDFIKNTNTFTEPIELIYAAQNIITISHQDKQNNILKLNILKTRTGTENVIENIKFNYKTLEIKQLNNFNMFIIKIKKLIRSIFCKK